MTEVVTAEEKAATVIREAREKRLTTAMDEVQKVLQKHGVAFSVQVTLSTSTDKPAFSIGLEEIQQPPAS